jgi:hypothetical protein
LQNREPITLAGCALDEGRADRCWPGRKTYGKQGRYDDGGPVIRWASAGL